MTPEELQDYKTENPEGEIGECTRCQATEPEEFLSKGLCDICYSDMYDEWK